jgi:hypothetical protein
MYDRNARTMESHCTYLINLFISQSARVNFSDQGFYDEELLNDILVKHNELVERYAFSVTSGKDRI